MKNNNNLKYKYTYNKFFLSLKNWYLIFYPKWNLKILNLKKSFIKKNDFNFYTNIMLNNFFNFSTLYFFINKKYKKVPYLRRKKAKKKKKKKKSLKEIKIELKRKKKDQQIGYKFPWLNFKKKRNYSFLYFHNLFFKDLSSQITTSTIRDWKKKLTDKDFITTKNKKKSESKLLYKLRMYKSFWIKPKYHSKYLKPYIVNFLLKTKTWYHLLNKYNKSKNISLILSKILKTSSFFFKNLFLNFFDEKYIIYIFNRKKKIKKNLNFFLFFFYFKNNLKNNLNLKKLKKIYSTFSIEVFFKKNFIKQFFNKVKKKKKKKIYLFNKLKNKNLFFKELNKIFFLYNKTLKNQFYIKYFKIKKLDFQKKMLLKIFHRINFISCLGKKINFFFKYLFIKFKIFKIIKFNKKNKKIKFNKIFISFLKKIKKNILNLIFLSNNLLFFKIYFFSKLMIFLKKKKKKILIKYNSNLKNYFNSYFFFIFFPKIFKYFKNFVLFLSITKRKILINNEFLNFILNAQLNFLNKSTIWFNQKFFLESFAWKNEMYNFLNLSFYPIKKIFFLPFIDLNFEFLLVTYIKNLKNKKNTFALNDKQNPYWKRYNSFFLKNPFNNYFLNDFLDIFKWWYTKNLTVMKHIWLTKKKYYNFFKFNNYLYTKKPDLISFNFLIKKYLNNFLLFQNWYLNFFDFNFFNHFKISNFFEILFFFSKLKFFNGLKHRRFLAYKVFFKVIRKNYIYFKTKWKYLYVEWYKLYNKFLKKSLFLFFIVKTIKLNFRIFLKIILYYLKKNKILFDFFFIAFTPLFEINYIKYRKQIYKIRKIYWLKFNYSNKTNLWHFIFFENSFLKKIDYSFFFFYFIYYYFYNFILEFQNISINLKYCLNSLLLKFYFSGKMSVIEIYSYFLKNYNKGWVELINDREYRWSVKWFKNLKLLLKKYEHVYNLKLKRYKKVKWKNFSKITVFNFKLIKFQLFNNRLINVFNKKNLYRLILNYSKNLKSLYTTKNLKKKKIIFIFIF